MAKIKTSCRVLYKGEFLPAGINPIDDKDVEVMRPYGEIIEEKPKKQGKKSALAEDDII